MNNCLADCIGLKERRKTSQTGRLRSDLVTKVTFLTVHEISPVTTTQKACLPCTYPCRQTLHTGTKRHCPRSCLHCGGGSSVGGAGPAKRSACQSFAPLTFHLQSSHFLFIKKLAPAANSLRLSLHDLLLKGFCHAFNFSRFFSSRESSSLLSQTSCLNHASPRVGPQETAL